MFLIPRNVDMLCAGFNFTCTTEYELLNKVKKACATNNFYFLMSLFYWGDSPQGKLFWQNVYHNAISLNELELLRELNKIFVIDDLLTESFEIQWE
jgi:hypothetical protein